MTLKEFNNLSLEAAKEQLFRCCGSTAWSKKLAAKIPFNSIEDLKIESDKIWATATKKSILEAFAQHPKIGENKALDKKFASTKEWASGEQSAVNLASDLVLKELAEGNVNYQKKFGFIFIVCASGKNASEMLEILKLRMQNPADLELKIAAAEQNKITHLRIDKLFL
jgi:2-oxo-4-hydroxy-4-carboxy-5-ureidoimidazoline decarboxylase